MVTVAIGEPGRSCGPRGLRPRPAPCYDLAQRLIDGGIGGMPAGRLYPCRDEAEKLVTLIERQAGGGGHDDRQIADR